MNILYDSQVFANQAYGGISKYFVELAIHLSSSDKVDLHILAPLYINEYLYRLNSNFVVGRKLKYCPRGSKHLLRTYNSIASSRLIYSYKPDILHETYYSPPLLSYPNSCARVTTVYDMIHEIFPEYFPIRDKTSLQKQLAISRADHVICISHKTREDLLNFSNMSPEKVSVIHLGLTPSKKSNISTSPLINTPYILYVGLRAGYKNFHRLLKAYSISPTLFKNYNLVCFGGRTFSPLELDHYSNLGIPINRVVWLGGGDDILTHLYKNAAAFIFPSLYEGFGIPPLEAMSNACPVVCSLAGSIPEVVGDAGEYFDPLDEESIASAIENVVSSEERIRQLVALGSQRAKLFTWDKCANSTYEVYSSLL